MRYVLHQEAQKEYEEAILHYADVSADLADAFVESVEAGIDSILDRPQAWKRVGRRVRRYLLHKFPYGIHYVVQDDLAIILAIAHMHRRSSYWRGCL